MRLGDDDRARIGAAVRAAERRTDAEILAIAAGRSDAYHDVALHWAALGALLPLALASAMPGGAMAVLDRVLGGSAWTAEPPDTGTLLLALLLATAALFLLLLGVLRMPALRLALTPPAARARRVRRRAVLLFRAAVEARTATHSGALIYVSLAEHRAEIVADAAIVARVPGDAWATAMAALVAAMRDGRPGDGIVAAIDAVAAILADHVPHTGTDPNELPDALVKL